MPTTLADDGTRLRSTPRTDLDVQQGVSTGCFYRTTTTDWDRLVTMASGVSTRAVELSALSADELPALVEFAGSWSGPGPFETVSVHAPAKNVNGNDDEICELLVALPAWVERIILHPDVVSTWAPWRRLGQRLAVENMDRRKGFGCTADELSEVFDRLPDARLCLDLAHITTIDPTMRLADEILDVHGDRLAEVHVSTTDVDAHHIPLDNRDARRFDAFVDTTASVPWIYEAIPE